MMKKRMFLTLGVLCLFGFYSCSNSVVEESEIELQSDDLSAKHKKDKGGTLPANFYDPIGLISRSSYSGLDTIQKGFGFTEPKIDCGGNCTDEQDAINRRSEFIIVKKNGLVKK